MNSISGLCKNPVRGIFMLFAAFLSITIANSDVIHGSGSGEAPTEEENARKASTPKVAPHSMASVT
ncbi:unnamed protein product [Clavelina lepadiformis]|uniref:Secreted protein n=1 Tax=Clavelina lepadiformis TaxID=159417 RepID=A0ABP0GEL0_CLALP